MFGMKAEWSLFEDGKKIRVQKINYDITASLIFHSTAATGIYIKTDINELLLKRIWKLKNLKKIFDRIPRRSVKVIYLQGMNFMSFASFLSNLFVC